ELGADVAEVARGMGLDQRIGPQFLRAGIGYGGSCFPKDVSALKQLAGNSGYHFQLLTAVIEVNDLQKRRTIGKLQKHLGSLAGADRAVLVTEWPEFRELDWAGEVKRRMAKPLVVDGRNFLDEKLMKDAGFTYEGIGRR